jgi:long-subunit fatty acid transport protein
MRPFLAALVVGIVLSATPAVASGASVDDASCMGLGASFYGQFAPQQMAFVAEFVNTTAMSAGEPPGATYSFFAGEKEGGAIPTPCGTRLE